MLTKGFKGYIQFNTQANMSLLFHAAYTNIDMSGYFGKLNALMINELHFQLVFFIGVG